jgi:magnesium chelatase family protein
MLAKLKTFALVGIEAVPVEVEVDVSPTAMPRTFLVGLPEQAVRESTHRVARALVNSGFIRPADRVVINLAPAELPKQAASFDLPISLGILAASGQMAAERFERYAVVGEVSLEGRTRPTKGALSMAITAAERGWQGIVVPIESAAEAAVVERIEVIPVGSLAEAASFMAGELDIAAAPSRLRQLYEHGAGYEDDYCDVRGQELAKRALTIAAAGSHNLLMVGPPGSGKSMLAHRLPTILPTLTATESIETTRIYSATGKLPHHCPLMVRRPFRSPHHTISEAGLVGGGSPPAPGEISLAHNGVLFLDELPEFNRRTLEVLRQPLEEGRVTISRALASTTFPADFMLIAALNPCPCGYLGDLRRRCSCPPQQVDRYMSKISGPLVDRIDIQIEVPTVDYQELAGSATGTDSATMRGQVTTARDLQTERFAGMPFRYNAQMSSRQLRTFCRLTADGRRLLEQSVEQLGLSARAHDKVLRVARTIADLELQDIIQPEHLSEAVNYRMLDRQLWTSRSVDN